MLIEEKKLFFKTAQVIFDDELALRCAQERKYDRLIILSHHALPLPYFEVVEKQGAVIDLTKNLEDVLASFNDTAQKKISRTMRYGGFRFVHYEYPFPPEVYRLYAQFERSKGRVPFSEGSFSSCVAFIGYDGGVAVSGAFVFPSIPILRARSFFSARLEEVDHDAYKRISYASNRIMYEVCVWGKEKGCSGFDISPVNSTDPEKSGISGFKLSFRPMSAKEYTYTRRSALYAFFEKLVVLIHRARRFV